MTDNNDTTRPDISHLRIDPKDKEKQSYSKPLFFLFISIIIIASLISAFFFFKNGTVEVDVAIAKGSSLKQGHTVLNANGYVTPRRRATIAAKITGRVVEMLVDEGMQVKEGQVLARLDDIDIKAMAKTVKAEVEVAQAAIAEIEVNLKNARRNLSRNKELYDTEFISERQMDDARTRVDSLSARLMVNKKRAMASRVRYDEVIENLKSYTITAPFSGVVVSKDAQVGEIVSPMSAGGGFTRTGIATIVDMKSLEVEVDVNESYIAKVKKDQKVTATLDAYPEWNIPASVRTIIPSADRQKATVKVRISFETLDPRILPDMGVKVSFLDTSGIDTSDLDTSGTSSGNESSVQIPENAVIEIAGRQVAFIFKNGYIEQRQIKIGQSNGDVISITAGIAPGEMVVTGNLETLEDGQKVRLKKDL